MTRLTDQLHEAAGVDDLDLDLDLDGLHARAGHRHRRQVRARAGVGVAGAVLVLALVGGVAASSSPGGDETTAVGSSVIAPPVDASSTSDPTSSTTEAPDATDGSSTTEVPTTGGATSVPPETSVAGPTTSTPATTAPTPTSDPPPSSAAVASLDLSYTAREEYRLGQPQCPDITHWMDGEAVATFDGRPEPSPEATYALREDYCGTHEGTTWVGEGTFSLVGPSGALRGRTISRAPVGTSGAPYRFVVESGEGDFDGWTGECEVTVTLTNQAFGRQDHEGTISCDLVAAPDVPATSIPDVPTSTTTPLGV